MPNMNGTGPLGAGQDTGRGLGPCGQGLRRGHCGWLHRTGRNFYAPENNLKSLEAEEKMLESELAAVRAEKEALKEEK